MTEIKERRRRLVKRTAVALYRFAVAYDDATWDGKRQGLNKPYPEGLRHASCSAFREWAIHVHDGTVAFSIDGFAQRSERETGSVYIASGGKFIFPPDNSRSNHSLRLHVDNGGELIPVTLEESVDWEPRVERMADLLEESHRELLNAVAAYDLDKQRDQERERKRRIEAAQAALS